MNGLFGLCVLAACTVAVLSESCTLNSDCMGTGCSSAFHVVCEHKIEDGVSLGGGLCTCAVSDVPCVLKADCGNYPCEMNGDRPRQLHCYDGKCICSRH